MPLARVQVPSDSRPFPHVMIALIDNIRNSLIIGHKILVKGSDTCPASCSFVTLHFFFFFSSSRNITLIWVTAVFVIIIYSASQLFAHSVFVTINIVSFNSSIKLCNTESYHHCLLKNLKEGMFRSIQKDPAKLRFSIQQILVKLCWELQTTWPC